MGIVYDNWVGQRHWHTECLEAEYGQCHTSCVQRAAFWVVRFEN